ncbi:hypothetical protein EJ110_NYTH07667 [Nymphaea thermarum]|nr:hypothetical protein EJ110_NYTH07667 [Nymphaea thermarum]
MDLSPELENYIQQSIEFAVGLPVSKDAFRSKLFAVEESRRVLQGESEAAMNAQALKKSIEQSQRLNSEVTNLTMQIAKLNKECSLYDNDREALMEFGNDADERARQAEACAQEAEDNSRRLSVEVNQSKQEIELLMADKTRHLEEQQLLRHRIVDLENERDDNNPVCPQCSNIKVSALFEENKLLDEENRKLLRRWSRERTQQGSPSSLSAKSKRKVSPRTSNASERASDIDGSGSPRRPLSPLEYNVQAARLCNSK